MSQLKASVRPPSVSDQYLRIDTLRGLACVLVVAWHAVGEILIKHESLSLLHQWQNGLAGLRMPLFMFISGLVYALRPFDPASAKRFVGGKAKRLILPFVTVTCLFVLAQELFGSERSEAITQALYNELLYPSSYLWFLEAIVLIFAGIAAGGYRPLRTSTGQVVLLLALVALSTSGPNLTKLFSFSQAVALAPFFVLGAAVLPILRVRQHATYTYVLSAGLLVMVAAGWQLGFADEGLLRYIASSVGLISLLIVFPVVPALAVIGRRSMTVYLFHYFVVVIAVKLAGAKAAELYVIVTCLGIVVPVLAEMALSSFAPALLPFIGVRRPTGLKPKPFRERLSEISTESFCWLVGGHRRSRAALMRDSGTWRSRCDLCGSPMVRIGADHWILSRNLQTYARTLLGPSFSQAWPVEQSADLRRLFAELEEARNSGASSRRTYARKRRDQG